MIDDRYYLHKIKVHDKICHRFMNFKETVEHMNVLYKKYTALKKENYALQKSLKEEYMAMSGCLCDACKYEEATYTNNWFVGEDYDVKCTKKHEILTDDDEQECNDFELRLEDLG